MVENLAQIDTAASTRFRLTRKLGFGLRPEEAIPDDIVGWASAQLDAVPAQRGIANSVRADISDSFVPEISAWPEKFILGLKQSIDNTVAEKLGLDEIDKKFDPSTPAWGDARRKLRETIYLRPWEVLRRSHQPVYSEQPVFERFSIFWANHFTVAPVEKADYLFGHYFDKAINANMLKDFASMLFDVTTHPCMQSFLDGPYSIGPNSRLGKDFRAKGQYADINENLGRELLELHTLSPAAGYSQADIVAVAKVLTGHGYTFQLPQRFPNEERWKVFFAERHEPGEKLALGQTYPSGKEALRDLTDFLAAQDATVLHLSRKLAKHFIADEPTDDDVAAIVSAWKENSGNLPAIHRAVIERAVKREEARKFQLPEIWLYQMLRISGAHLFNGWEQTLIEDFMYDSFPRSPDVLLEELGHSYWVKRQPNGYSEDRADWISPEHIDRRLRFAQLAMIAGKPPLSAEDLLNRMGVSSETRKLVTRSVSQVNKFVLLFVSPELMEA